MNTLQNFALCFIYKPFSNVRKCIDCIKFLPNQDMSTCVWYLLEKQGRVGVFSFVGHSHSSDNASGSKRHQALNMRRIQQGGFRLYKDLCGLYTFYWNSFLTLHWPPPAPHVYVCVCINTLTQLSPEDQYKERELEKKEKKSSV